MQIQVRSHPTWVRGLKPGRRDGLGQIRGSHPTWVRGLKHAAYVSRSNSYVAPHVGAWIETRLDYYGVEHNLVAPHVGAWIETFRY